MHLRICLMITLTGCGGQPGTVATDVRSADALLGSVSSFTLINANTDNPISDFDPIREGAVIDLGRLPTANLNIRANLAFAVGSVRFGYDGDANYQTENVAPYALAGDRRGDYAAWTPTLGSHAVSATAFSKSGARGSQSATERLSFTIVENTGTPDHPEITSFSLINADTDAPIPGYDTITDGAVLDLDQLPTSHLNIRANTSPSVVGSVRFDYDGNAAYQTENVAPYALAGDRAGDYQSWTPSLGAHVVKATAFAERGAAGTSGSTRSLHFTVESNDDIPPPVVGLHVSANGRHLEDENGDPVFLLGDTAWAMPENASRTDVDDYLADRRSRGFNYIQIVAVRDLDSEPLSATPSRTMNPSNRYGHRPFEWNADNKADIARPIVVSGGSPNAPNDYWDHLEYVIRAARNAGMVVGMLPVWGKYYINTPYADLRLFDDSSATSYGYFLAERYRDYQDIIWILGGDTTPQRHVDARSIYRSLAEGIVAGATGLAPAWDEPHAAWHQVLLTTHLTQSDGTFDGDPWVTIKAIYNQEGDLYPDTAAAWNMTPVRPLMVGESRYEGWIWNGTYKSPRLVRRQIYHGYLGGSHAGYVVGTAMSVAEAHDQMFRFQTGWRSRLDLPSVRAMQHFGELLAQHRWWDTTSSQQTIAAPVGTGVALKAATLSNTGDELLVYLPFSSATTVDLNAITSHPRVRATWFDPRDGTTQSGGVYQAGQWREFSPPTGWEDALLILEGTNQALDQQQPDSADFRTIDGEVVIAAEDYSSTGGSLGDWNAETLKSGYLDSGYLRSGDDDPQLQFSQDIAHLDYVIKFEEAGRYFIHLRTLAMDHTENGFFATLNGQEVNYGGANPADPAKKAYYIYVQKSGHWSWYTDGGGAETRDLKVSFQIPTPGKYTFSIYRRDTGSRLDHIWLTKHQSSPQATGSLALPDAANFLN